MRGMASSEGGRLEVLWDRMSRVLKRLSGLAVQWLKLEISDKSSGPSLPETLENQIFHTVSGTSRTP